MNGTDFHRRNENDKEKPNKKCCQKDAMCYNEYMTDEQVTDKKRQHPALEYSLKNRLCEIL